MAGRIKPTFPVSPSMKVYRPDGPLNLIKVILLVSNTHWIDEKSPAKLKMEPLAMNLCSVIDERDLICYWCPERPPDCQGIRSLIEERPLRQLVWVIN